MHDTTGIRSYPQRKFARLGLVAGIASLLALSSAQAQAQAQALPETKDFAVERFALSIDRNGIMNVEFGRVPEHLSFDVSVWIGWSRNPLVIYRRSNGDRLASLVRDRVGGGLLGAISLFRWIEIGFELPFVLYQNRDSSIDLVPSASLGSLSASALSDLRLVPKLRLLRSDQHKVDLAFVAQFTVPTGRSKHYAGEEFLTFQPELILSRAWASGFRLAFNLGGTVRRVSALLNQRIESEIWARLGGAYYFGNRFPKAPVELGLALSGAFSAVHPFAERNQSPLEIDAQLAGYPAADWQLFIGGGAGLVRGWGTPDFRLFLGARYSHHPKDRDRDGIEDRLDRCPDAPEDKDLFEDSDGCPDPDNDRDGILDVNDKCPLDPEDRDQFQDDDGCPDPDNDRDGILDVNDKCPLDPEDRDQFQDEDGCPDPDNDQDGILDVNDKCPMEPEDKDKFEDEDGCPDPDNDRDGVLDTADACPLEKGLANNAGCPVADRDHDGIVDSEDNCPDEAGTHENGGCKTRQLVVMKGTRLDIIENVFFALDKDIILPRSFPLLDNVAKVILAHPNLTLVRIEGHTDSQGKLAHNMDLSKRRANAVMTYLIGKKVDAKRLQAEGFGPNKPIADNKTKEGRAKNRRVVFTLIGDSKTIEQKQTGPSQETMERLP